MEHLDFRKLEDVDDDIFAYLMEKVKGVNMLDLNGTDISNESMRLLTRLEYIYELRMKDCTEINDEAIPYINQLSSLRLLHVKDTNITIEGLLKLTNLHQLEDLIFSATEHADISSQLYKLQEQLIGCRLFMNGKPYRIEN